MRPVLMGEAGGGRRDLVPRGDHRQSGPKGLRPEEREMAAPPAVMARTITGHAIRRVTDPKNGDLLELKIDPIKANPGETIRWEVEDEPEHVISVWFPDTGVFVTPVIAVMHKGPVEATVRDYTPDLKADALVCEYAIYSHTDRKFVTCQSHPRIELPGGGG